MGRHAGFLTASSSLLRKENDDGPNLIYIPESPFELDIFLNQVKNVFEKYGRCVMAISEGIQDKEKKLISQKIIKKTEYDSHGNIQLSGTGSLGDYLSGEIKEKLKLTRVRADTLGYPQRCFLGSTSEIDQKEALQIGIFASKYSNKNNISFSAGILERKKFSTPYSATFIANSLEKVAGKTKILPQSFYNVKKSFITNSFINYALPLIGKKILKTKSLI